jgi:hypothetical protein
LQKSMLANEMLCARVAEAVFGGYGLRPSLGVIRIAVAGAGVQPVKECSFPGGRGAGAAKSGGKRERGEGAAIEG